MGGEEVEGAPEKYEDGLLVLLCPSSQYSCNEVDPANSEVFDLISTYLSYVLPKEHRQNQRNRITILCVSEDILLTGKLRAFLTGKHKYFLD